MPRALSRVVPAPRLRTSDVWFALLGMAPDLDLLFGTHNTYTHSVGTVAIVVLVAAGVEWLGGRRAFALATAAGAAYASHLLLDWLGTDTSPPFGIMLLWPFSDEHYKAPVSWFLPVLRNVWTREFWAATPLAVFTELAIFCPIAWAVRRWRA